MFLSAAEFLGVLREDGETDGVGVEAICRLLERVGIQHLGPVCGFLLCFFRVLSHCGTLIKSFNASWPHLLVTKQVPDGLHTILM